MAKKGIRYHDDIECKGLIEYEDDLKKIGLTVEDMMREPLDCPKLMRFDDYYYCCRDEYKPDVEYRISKTTMQFICTKCKQLKRDKNPVSVAV